jgi:hypothetical protein
MRNLLLIALFASTITACSPYDPDLGPSPFLCGPADQDPRCPDGYTCTMMGTQEYCLAMGGMVPVDGAAFNCADDSNLEPNETTPFDTSVATQKSTITFAGLAICPAGDRDLYTVTITFANQNLEMLMEYDPAAADLQGSILNSGRTPIANASPTEAGKRRAYTPNLPTGIYYVAISGPTMGDLTMNNYKMTINVTGP